MAAEGEQSLMLCVQWAATLPRMSVEPHNAYMAQGRTMEIRLGHRALQVTIRGLLHFELDLHGRSIQCHGTHETRVKLIQYWFLQQVLPMFLLLSGSVELLHATAVQLARGAVAFLGCSGIGKSTLLHHCLSQGGALITDEHLAIDRSDYTKAVPSLPFYRPYRSVEDLGMRATRFQRQPTALRRMYILKPAGALDPVSAQPLANAELIANLLNNRQYNLFHPDVPQFLPIMQERFTGLANMARTIEVKRLNVPRSLERLPEVYEFIQRDMAS